MKQFYDTKVFNTRLLSFVIEKNYGSLTHETRIKDAVNMEDLICLLATVCTLKSCTKHWQTRSILKKTDRYTVKVSMTGTTVWRK